MAFKNLIKALSSALCLASCSGMQKSEQDNLRRHNAKAELIERSHDDSHYPLEVPAQKVREKYPWE